MVIIAKSLEQSGLKKEYKLVCEIRSVKTDLHCILDKTKTEEEGSLKLKILDLIVDDVDQCPATPGSAIKQQCWH